MCNNKVLKSNTTTFAVKLVYVSTSHRPKLYLQLFLTACVLCLDESVGIPWISTLTKGSKDFLLLGIGRLDPLITCRQTRSRDGWSVSGETERKRRQQHRKRGGEPLWSPHCAVTLSPLCSCCDQRQTCMYRSTDGASHYPSHNYTPFPAPKPPSRAPCIKEELYLWTWTLSVRHKIWNPDFCLKLSFILNGILGTGGGLLSWGDE